MCDTYTPDQHLTEALKQSEILMDCLGNDINRQIIILLASKGKEGMRVPEITAKTFLSRPSVTLHLKQLQEAGIVRVFRKGTMNFYYLYISSEPLQNIKQLYESMDHYFHLQEEKK